MPAEGFALTPAASGASSSRTPMWCCEFPSLLWVLSRSRGQPAIHSSISAHDGVRPRPDGLNQKRRPHQSRWATALVELASVRSRDSGGGLGASDLPVAPRIEDEGQELAGDGDPGPCTCRRARRCACRRRAGSGTLSGASGRGERSAGQSSAESGDSSIGEAGKASRWAEVRT